MKFKSLFNTSLSLMLATSAIPADSLDFSTEDLQARVDVHFDFGPSPYYYGPYGPYGPCTGVWYDSGVYGPGFYFGPGCPSYYYGPDYYRGRRHWKRDKKHRRRHHRGR